MLGILSNARSAACMTGRIGETMMPRSNYHAALESEIQRRLEADPPMLPTLKAGTDDGSTSGNLQRTPAPVPSALTAPSRVKGSSKERHLDYGVLRVAGAVRSVTMLWALRSVMPRLAARSRRPVPGLWAMPSSHGPRRGCLYGRLPRPPRALTSSRRRGQRFTHVASCDCCGGLSRA
jgi:hypothetical protein